MGKLTFWETVKTELKKSGKTQVQLCEYCQIPVGSLRTRISANSIPNVIEAYKIAKFLNTSVEYLVTGEASSVDSSEIDVLKDKLSRIEKLLQNIRDVYGE